MNNSFKLNTQGVRELMQSEEMINVLKSYGNAIMSNLGDGYEESVQVGKTRANVRIEAVGFFAIKDNYKNNTLLKALQG